MTSRHEGENTSPRSALVMFPRRRGRPRKPIPKRDSGTPELAQKRLSQETTEALDLCLDRNIITPVQHWCGIHLRWLYTLRYGAPGVRAIDPTHLSGADLKMDDPGWRQAREQEYVEAMRLLSEHRCATLLMNICIYNERPIFLKCPASWSARHATASRHMMEKLCEGLNRLSFHWRCS